MLSVLCLTVFAPVAWLLAVFVLTAYVNGVSVEATAKDRVAEPLMPPQVMSCPVCHRGGGQPNEIDFGMARECRECHGGVREVNLAPAVRLEADRHVAQGQAKHINSTAMVEIPGGPFTIGYDHRHPDEKPAHTISIPSFFIDLYEATNGQYKEFIDAMHRTPPDNWNDRTYPPGKKNHPVVFVTWYDAHDYCEWVEKRLPQEEEWEKAARGTDGRLYPWGNDFDPRKANTPQSHSTGTTPVGSYPKGRSPYGLYDMGGNAWEWTDSWAKPYPGSPIPTGHYFTGEYKVLKGGSWVDCSFYRCGISSLTFNRGYFKPFTKNQGFGFRCAKDDKNKSKAG